MWSPWSNFCPCSETCGDGVKSQKRKCYCGDEFEEEATILPQPGCEGPSVNEIPCSDGSCDPADTCVGNPDLQCQPGRFCFHHKTTIRKCQPLSYILFFLVICMKRK